MLRSRHRVPSIFSLSMVDVLCCSLGCVILLWLINLREAKLRAVTAGQTHNELVQARSRLDDAARDLTAARRQLTEAEKTVTDLRARAADLDDRLTKRKKDLDDQTAAADAARRRAAELLRLMRDKETLVKDMTRSADELSRRLKDQDTRVKSLETELASAGASSKSMESSRKDLERQLADAVRALDLLKDERKGLVDQVRRAKEAADHRFAGITLTGRRVLFLVDMSGSMESLDENTPAPTKWKDVCETVAKVMRSLPDLEQFQVMVFAEAVAFPLGREGGWVDYGKDSADQVNKALLALKPVGGTNMYLAFDAAFKLRARGLDTVYLFSDGLPNIGVGLTADQVRTLKETEKGEILGGIIRRSLKTDWNRPAPGRQRVRINTIGFFYESPDVGAFLWALARENDGSFVGMSRP